MDVSLLLGDPGALPFLGHLRTRLEVSGAKLWAAGRVFSGGDVVEAYEASRNLTRVIEESGARLETNASRHDLLRCTWEALAELDADQMGRDAGRDVQLLLTAEDTDGVGVAGVGLSMVYGLIDQRFQPLVSGDHPLLCGPGLPGALPGVLTLDRPVQQVLGIPNHLSTVLSEDLDLARDCGWRP